MASLKGLVALLAMLIACGCSNFDREWQGASGRPTLREGADGPWRGAWTSDADGHNGDLECAVRKTGERQYLASFHATYAGFLEFKYDLPLESYDRDGVTFFQGRADLGPLAGGEYDYDGHADGRHFFLTYRAKYDSGHFVMVRPEAPPGRS